MFRFLVCIVAVLLISGCTYTNEFVIKNQQATQVFYKVKQYFVESHPKVVGQYEFLDFEFAQAEAETLKLVLYYRDNKKGALSKLNVDHADWRKTKRFSRKLDIRFFQSENDVVLRVETVHVFESDKIHDSFFDYVKILYLDLQAMS